MSITITDKPRWRVNFNFIECDTVMVGRVGPYDVLHDRMWKTYTVVRDGPASVRAVSGNYTEYAYGPAGDLAPSDTDVVLDPYHMCLLYQLVAAIGDPVRT